MEQKDKLSLCRAAERWSLPEEGAELLTAERSRFLISERLLPATKFQAWPVSQIQIANYPTSK